MITWFNWNEQNLLKTLAIRNWQSKSWKSLKLMLQFVLDARNKIFNKNVDGKSTVDHNEFSLMNMFILKMMHFTGFTTNIIIIVIIVGHFLPIISSFEWWFMVKIEIPFIAIGLPDVVHWLADEFPIFIVVSWSK